MTQEDATTHWQKGARRAFRAAELTHGERDYELALFHCHLAVEKALKALYIQQRNTAAPKSHDLSYLALQITHGLPAEQVELLKELNQFCIEARYSDPPWAELHATQERAERWMQNVRIALSSLLP